MFKKTSLSEKNWFCFRRVYCDGGRLEDVLLVFAPGRTSLGPAFFHLWPSICHLDLSDDAMGKKLIS